MGYLTCKAPTITCTGGLIPNPRANEAGQAQCICPNGGQYYDALNGCVQNCPFGNPSPSSGALIGEPISCEGPRHF